MAIQTGILVRMAPCLHGERVLASVSDTKFQFALRSHKWIVSGGDCFPCLLSHSLKLFKFSFHMSYLIMVEKEHFNFGQLTDARG